MSRYKAYAEYKESGVDWMGKIPIHWQLLRFKHVLHEKKKTSNPGLDAGSISFGNVIFKNSDNLSLETKESYQEVLEGEFLINPLNLNYDLMSLRTALSSINVVVSTGYIVLQANGRLIKRYIRWLLQQFDVAHMKTLGSGVRQTINYSDIGNSFFYEPSQEEQISISNFLDHETAKIDALIEKQQELIKLLKEKRQAVISHAVTKGLNPNAPMRDSGVEWLGEVPAHWQLLRIKNIAELNPSKSQVDDKKHLECSFVPMEKLKTDSLELDEVRQVSDIFDGYTYFQDEDILMAKVTPCFENKNIAIAKNLINGIGFGSTEIYVLRVSIKVLNTFLYYRLQDEGFMASGISAMSGAGGLKRVPADVVANFSLGLPPINEQKEIVDSVRKVATLFDDLNSRAVDAIGLLQERRTALISAAVTGKIDVRDWQPSSTSTQPKAAA